MLVHIDVDALGKNMLDLYTYLSAIGPAGAVELDMYLKWYLPSTTNASESTPLAPRSML